MEQQKIGAFIKMLRKEKGITQEQLAEIEGVSNRTVSRWETGSNLPDFDVLIELSDYFGVELREMLEGESKSEKMNKEVEETALKAVEYTNDGLQKFTLRVHRLLVVGVCFWLVSAVLQHTSLVNNAAFSALADFSAGAACGMVLCGIFLTGRFGKRSAAFKQRLLARENKKTEP